MKWLNKKADPALANQVPVGGIQTCVVRWTSVRATWPGLVTRPEAQIFTNRQDADKFADDLKAAFKLIRYEDLNEVSVEFQ